MWSCPSSWSLLGPMDHPGREEEDHTPTHLGITPRSTWSKTRLPQNISWGLIHQGTRPRINPCFRHGYPGTYPGALDTSRDLYQPPRNTSKDQSKLRARIPCNISRGPRKHLGSLLLGPRPRTPVIYWGPTQGSFCLVLDQEPQSSTGGPHKGLLPWL
jgi:hypothetical protein